MWTLPYVGAKNLGSTMRYLRLAALTLTLAGCNSAQTAQQVSNAEYAIDSYEQSVEAYQLCIRQNADDPQKCGALARVIEADKKRYDKSTPGL
jgi:hypothetical protein